MHMTENLSRLSQSSSWRIISFSPWIHVALRLSLFARQAIAVTVHRRSTPTTTQHASITAAATRASATLSARPFTTFSPALATVKQRHRSAQITKIKIKKFKETVILKALTAWEVRSCCVCTGTQLKCQCNLTSFAETEHSCKMCCRKKDGTCSPFVQADGSFLFLRKGKPCTVGFCEEGVSLTSSVRHLFSGSPLTSSLLAAPLEQGKCMKQVQDVIERLWDFIDKLDINTFGE